MNLKDLKYFSSLAKHKNFSKAAEECFVTQPTLSNQINKLEQELGLTLFERTNRKVTITEEGRLILEAAQKTLETASEIEKIAHRFKQPLMGKMTLGAIHTLSPYLLPIILLPLKEAYPDLDLIIVEATTSELGTISITLLEALTCAVGSQRQARMLFSKSFMGFPDSPPICSQDRPNTPPGNSSANSSASSIRTGLYFQVDPVIAGP